MSKTRLRLQEAVIVAKYGLCALGARFVKRDHWVLCERGDDARDNGYAFYRYLVKEHPEQQVYYLIDKNSPDWQRVCPNGVPLGSWRGYWLLATTPRLVGTHYGSGLPLRSTKLFRLLRLDRKFYFLQHGITKNHLRQLYAPTAPMRLFVCGAKPEYDFLHAVSRHPEGVVRYTGLARFDWLHRFTVKRQLLVMPTWRSYITSEEEFLSSRFFTAWQKLLEDPRLLACLRQQELTLVFYPHYGMQPYIRHFSEVSDRVVIADFAHYDVQTLLKESALLVTDFSSVFFDFAYMQKPVVYYQFDEEEFYSRHYERGYFDYHTMGFGPVCAEHETLVETLLQLCRWNLTLEESYRRRIQGFFPLHDTNNCQRIYEIIRGDEAL